MNRKIQRHSLNAENGSYDLCTVDNNTKCINLHNTTWHGKYYFDLPVYCGNLFESIWHGCREVKHVNFPHLALELQLAGKTQYLSDNKLKITEPGSLYIIAPGSSVRFSSFPDTPSHRLVLLIKGNNLNSITSTLHLDKDCCVKVDKYEELAEKFRKFVSLPDNDRNAARINSSMTYDLLLEISGMLPNATEPAQKILKIIEERYPVNISISELCSRYGISNASLWRFFKKEFGVSPMEYLTDLRLKKGLEILRNTDLSIRTIARNCGIHDASNFCALFKKKYGSTPEVFRNYLKEQEKH